MISLYLFFVPVFVWMNLYYLANITKLDVRFYEHDFSQSSVVAFIYYISKFLFWIWIIVGLIFIYKEFLWYGLVVLSSLSLFKFPLFHLNKRIYRYYNVFLPVISILTLIITFIYCLIY